MSDLVTVTTGKDKDLSLTSPAKAVSTLLASGDRFMHDVTGDWSGVTSCHCCPGTFADLESCTIKPAE